MTIEPDFLFTEQNLEKAKNIIKKYPKGRMKSAILPLLDLAQRQNNNYLSTSSMEYVAQLLEMPFIRVYEIATFYTMFNLKPVGQYHIQVCTTTPCWLRGSDQILNAIEEELDIKCGEMTKEQKFSLKETQCLGGCVNAPIMQINDDYIENLTPELIKNILLNRNIKKK